MAWVINKKSSPPQRLQILHPWGLHILHPCAGGNLLGHSAPLLARAWGPGPPTHHVLGRWLRRRDWGSCGFISGEFVLYGWAHSPSPHPQWGPQQWLQWTWPRCPWHRQSRAHVGALCVSWTAAHGGPHRHRRESHVCGTGVVGVKCQGRGRSWAPGEVRLIQNCSAASTRGAEQGWGEALIQSYRECGLQGEWERGETGGEGEEMETVSGC